MEKEGDGGLGDEGVEEPRLVKVDEEAKEAVKAVTKKRTPRKKGKKADEEEVKAEADE